jgi:hypothetical protein
MLTKSLVQRYIQPSNNEAVQIKGNYKTDDIVSVVLATDTTAWQNTAELSKQIKYTSIKDVCSQIWYFLKNNIKYQEDTPGQQLVKTPSALWNDRTGDCKSYSIFTASILRNLGINYAYRFVSFSGTETPTHVYVIAYDGATPIIIDAVWTSFNSQKQYTFKKDYNMKNEPGLYAVSGVGVLRKTAQPTIKKAGVLNIVSHHPHDLDLAIARQRIEIDQANMLRKGTPLAKRKADGYAKVINVLHRYQTASVNNDFKTMSGIISGLPDGRERDFLTQGYMSKVEGIGKLSFSSLKPKAVIKTATANAKTVIEAAKPKNVITQVKATQTALLPKNIVSTAKSVTTQGVDLAAYEAKKAADAAKGVWENTTEAGFKVINKVRYAMAKPMLEIMLPVASPMFLYSFADSAYISEKARKKQVRSHDLLKAIANATGATLDQVQAIVRNAIVKKTGKQPEMIIHAWKFGQLIEVKDDDPTNRVNSGILIPNSDNGSPVVSGNRYIQGIGSDEPIDDSGSGSSTASTAQGTAEKAQGWMSMITSCANAISSLVASIRKMTGKNTDGVGPDTFPSSADFDGDGKITPEEQAKYDAQLKAASGGLNSKDSGSFCKKRGE